MISFTSKYLCIFISIASCASYVMGQGSSCFTCHSRGKLGDCRDPFAFNASMELPEGVKKTPCPTGWCMKKILGDPYGDDHDLATSRACLSREPPAGAHQCGDVLIDGKKTFACYCKGDLCNGASQIQGPLFHPFLLALAATTYSYSVFSATR